MHELVVLSGKGGTGKTSITAAFATLAPVRIVVDCDVDAADLHLVLQPRLQESEEFRGGHEAAVRPELCTGCGLCVERCRFHALALVERDGAGPVAALQPFSCEGCGLCVDLCPVDAIDFPTALVGRHFRSATDGGPMIHGRLEPGAENSGRLVSLLREEARDLSAQSGIELVLVDGPPGLGCPVVASITGADEVLFVAEPSAAGLHDLERSFELARHFSVPARLVVNRWDLSAEGTEAIEACARRHGVALMGRVPWDPEVTRAHVRGRSVVEVSDGPAALAIRRIWNELETSWKGPRS